MAVSQQILRSFAAQETLRESSPRVNTANSEGKQTAFLCHSHKDAQLAKGVQAWLHSQRWFVYIDWDDYSMPNPPNLETAEKIQRRITELTWFLFLATANSISSKWCPWEIGFADGKKGPKSIIVLPTHDGTTNYGSEYLALYRYIYEAQYGGFLIFEAGSVTGGRSLSRLGF